ncbi:MAG TPA: RNA polymerase sigma factor [Bryobacteraceae bacterium]|nr:RNA polymerase sigma factor [Bryobacteraceae bacterium]
MSEANEHDLLLRMASGDAEAFTALYRRHQGTVYRFALQMSGSGAIADDVVQETFLLLMRAADSYDAARGSLGAFLLGVARHQVLRRLERRWVLGEEAPAEPVAVEQPEADLARSQMIEAVRRAVLALPVHYREAVVLCDLEEADYADAAAALGCSVGTVKSRLHRGRRLLAQRLEAYDGGQVRRGIRPAGVGYDLP